MTLESEVELEIREHIVLPALDFDEIVQWREAVKF
jgi:hypothetical protein